MSKMKVFSPIYNKNKFLKKILRFLIFNFYHGITSPFRKFFTTVETKNRYLAQLNVISEVHKKTFSKYKNINNGKDIVIVATGPSLNKFQPFKKALYIGVNKACLFDKIQLDYFFAIDYLVTKNYINSLLEYKNKNLKIFLGVHPQKSFNFSEIKSLTIMPESQILKLNANKFYVYTKYPSYGVNFNTEIDKTWLVEGGSCIFSAMQFALFTNPKRIYLVGCDCSSGYFDEKNSIIKPNKNLVKVWKELKKFAETYYPETEIISVNPVGLKGVFKDLYQDDEQR